MKIIHSYWSKPYIKNIREGYGGWSDKGFHYMSQALSCLKYKEFYRTELITDAKGYEVLIELLKLPYDNVHIILDKINKYPEGAWALGKLYSYKIQNEPFIHVDSDSYIWSKFPSSIEESGLIAQEFEIGYEINSIYYKKLERKLPYIPKSITNYHSANNIKETQINAGLFGGNDIQFIQKFADEAFNFITLNPYNKLSKNIPSWVYNTYFEQFLFYCLALEANKKITCLLSEETKENINKTGCIDIFQIPFNNKFIHYAGDAKRNPSLALQMSQRLYYEYPEYYFKIKNLIKQRII